MLKGAIVLFAFSLFLFGCQAKVAYPPFSEPVPPPPLSILTEEPVLFPDLTITRISLDESGRLAVALSNIGKNPVSYLSGNLKIYVDGDLKWSIPFERIPDHAFLQPGGVTLYTTPVELEGTHSVRAVIDSDEEIVEEDESNNTLTQTLSYEMAVQLPPPVPSLPPPPPPRPETQEATLLFPDVTITNISLNPQRQLVVALANIGEGIFPMRDGTLRVIVDGIPKGSYMLRSLTDQDHLLPREGMTLATPLTLVGRHEVSTYIDIDPGLKERNPENNGLKKILESLPIGPDIIVKDLELTDDFELSILLSNAGEAELRKGTTLRIRVFLNGQKVSEFDHFISEPLKSLSRNRYAVTPPYRIRVDGNSKVRVSVWPKGGADDIRLDNNTLEQYFTIFPFILGPQKGHEFPFLPFSDPLKNKGKREKVKVEARWDGGGFPLRLRLKGSADFRKFPAVSGKSPLKMEIPIEDENDQKGHSWRISVDNLMENKAEGFLIIQTP